jgi:hypothetical protein
MSATLAMDTVDLTRQTAELNAVPDGDRQAVTMALAAEAEEDAADLAMYDARKSELAREDNVLTK